MAPKIENPKIDLWGSLGSGGTARLQVKEPPTVRPRQNCENRATYQQKNSGFDGFEV